MGPDRSARAGWRTTLDRERQREKDAMHYDAVIIGSGQAGNPLWQYDPIRRGWSVAPIEHKELGGTCVDGPVPRIIED